MAKDYNFIVYKTTELSTGKIYIGYDSYNREWYYGSGTYFLNRIYKVIKEYTENNLNEGFDPGGHPITFYKRYNKIITLLFTKEILAQYETMEEMVQDEPNWIKKFNATNHDIGYNIIYTPTFGDTWTNNPNKEEISRKKSEKLKGRKFTEEHKKNLSIANKGQVSWATGKKFTDDHRQKLSDVNKGKILTSETKKKLSLAKTGSIQSEETKKKLSILNSGENNSFYGKHHTKEVCEKTAKPIIQYDKNMNKLNEFYSISEAARQTKLDRVRISSVCAGHGKSAGGFIWKYKESE